MSKDLTAPEYVFFAALLMLGITVILGPVLRPRLGLAGLAIFWVISSVILGLLAWKAGQKFPKSII